MLLKQLKPPCLVMSLRKFSLLNLGLNTFTFKPFFAFNYGQEIELPFVLFSSCIFVLSFWAQSLISVQETYQNKTKISQQAAAQSAQECQFCSALPVL